MAKFRKITAVIEALQWTGMGFTELVPAWVAVAFRERTVIKCDDTLVIRTLEGGMTAQPADWIIRGVAGEIYPCKPDIFIRIYDPVS